MGKVENRDLTTAAQPREVVRRSTWFSTAAAQPGEVDTSQYGLHWDREPRCNPALQVLCKVHVFLRLSLETS